MPSPDLSVVFPVYNEEENIPILLDEIVKALDGNPWSYEVVAVDDGSTDRSLAVLRASRTKHPNLRVLTFEKNSGQTAALDAAWRAARGTFVVSLDADLQNDPADIPAMMRTLVESCRYGDRRPRESPRHVVSEDAVEDRQRRSQLDYS